MKPLRNYVQLKMEKPQSKAGLTIVGDRELEVGTILTLGSDVTSLKKGQKVFVKNFSLERVEYKGTEYVLAKEEDIMATM